MPTLRIATPEDAGGCLEIYRPAIEHSAVSFETEVPSPDDFALRLRSRLDSHPWLVAVADGVIAGYAYAGRHRERAAYQWCTEVSAYVREDCRRRGVARRLYACLFDILRGQGFVNAYAGITLPNGPSVAFHESMGFEATGVYPAIGYKFGQWHDVGWWTLRLADRHPQAPPRAFAQARAETAVILAAHNLKTP